uniref:Uncharacterized protein n=1 Tax=Ditylenchus dipsaci TaxID=166011 RepID=A0A915DAT5_9BILA
MPIKSDIPAVEVANESLANRFFASLWEFAVKSPTQLAFINGKNESDCVSFQQLFDVVVVVLPNCWQYAAIFGGTILQGGAISGASPAYTHYELKRQFVDCSCKLVFCADSNSEQRYHRSTERCNDQSHQFGHYDNILEGYTKHSIEPYLGVQPLGLNMNYLSCLYFQAKDSAPILLLLAKSPVVAEYDLSSVKLVMSGAASAGKELCEEVINRLPHIQLIGQGFGMSELSLASHSLVLTKKNFPASGKLLPNMEAKIVCPISRKELSREQKGELMIRDQEGFLYIVDRLKELIKVKGFQVAPAELEDLLLSHPCIRDCAVIGIPDSKAGEIPKAFIVKSKDSLTEQQVMDFVKGLFHTTKFSARPLYRSIHFPVTPSHYHGRLPILMAHLRALLAHLLSILVHLHTLLADLATLLTHLFAVLARLLMLVAHLPLLTVILVSRHSYSLIWQNLLPFVAHIPTLLDHLRTLQLFHIKMASPRKFFVGGNWKMNGDFHTIDGIIAFLNQSGGNPSVDVVVAPPAPYLAYVKEHLKAGIQVAAQNCYKVEKGAFTGEISPAMIKDLGLQCWKSVKLAKTKEVNFRQLQAIVDKQPNWDPFPEQAQEVHAWIREFLQEKVSADVSKSTRIIYGGSVTAENCAELGKKPTLMDSWSEELH